MDSEVTWAERSAASRLATGCKFEYGDILAAIVRLRGTGYRVEAAIDAARRNKMTLPDVVASVKGVL